MKMLEDVGFYCVDNLPVSFIEKFVGLVSAPNNEISKVALGLDARANQSFDEVERILENLRKDGCKFEILFMDASDQVLLKRYKETRRVHPLSPEGRVEDGISREREILKEIKGKADYVIDSSSLLTRELKEELDRIFVQNKGYNSLMINIVSFGFKNGIPADADLVFDVRFLPNPFYIPELKHKTGLDEEVVDFVMSHPEAQELLHRYENFLQYALPLYVKEGKSQLTIAVGCTGGKHRSITFARKLAEYCTSLGYEPGVQHRDAVR